MDIALTATLIAAVVSVIGWIVNYVLSSLAERQRQKLSASLLHIESQLEQLYGPLAFLIIEGRRSFIDLLDVLGRNYVFYEGGNLPEDELKIWLFWVEHDMFPRNEKIKTLLSTNTHLIEGDKIPHSYVRFLEHYNSWKMIHLLWQKEGIEYSWRSKINWPRDFENDVMATFENLKKKHSELLGKTSKKII